MKITKEQIEDMITIRTNGDSRYVCSKKLNMCYNTVSKHWTMTDDELRALVKPFDITFFTNDDIWCENYAYLFGCYLSNGYINLHNAKYNIFKIRIYQNSLYNNLIEEHKQALSLLCNNAVYKYVNEETNLAEVGCYSQNIDKFFPNYQSGPKHLQPLVLTEWQLEILDRYGIAFIRGMMQTDGSRSVTGNNFIRYNYTNCSKDIISLFTVVLDKYNLEYVVSTYDSSYNNKATGATAYCVQFRVGSRLFLEQHVGPKS